MSWGREGREGEGRRREARALSTTTQHPAHHPNPLHPHHRHTHSTNYKPQKPQKHKRTTLTVCATTRGLETLTGSSSTRNLPPGEATVRYVRSYEAGPSSPSPSPPVRVCRACVRACVHVCVCDWGA